MKEYLCSEISLIKQYLNNKASKKVITGDKLEKVDAKVAVVYCIPRKNKYWGRVALQNSVQLKAV